MRRAQSDLLLVEPRRRSLPRHCGPHIHGRASHPAHHRRTDRSLHIDTNVIAISQQLPPQPTDILDRVQRKRSSLPLPRRHRRPPIHQRPARVASRKLPRHIMKLTLRLQQLPPRPAQSPTQSPNPGAAPAAPPPRASRAAHPPSPQSAQSTRGADDPPGARQQRESEWNPLPSLNFLTQS